MSNLTVKAPPFLQHILFYEKLTNLAKYLRRCMWRHIAIATNRLLVAARKLGTCRQIDLCSRHLLQHNNCLVNTRSRASLHYFRLLLGIQNSMGERNLTCSLLLYFSVPWNSMKSALWRCGYERNVCFNVRMLNKWEWFWFRSFFSFEEKDFIYLVS